MILRYYKKSDKFEKTTFSNIKNIENYHKINSYDEDIWYFDLKSLSIYKGKKVSLITIHNEVWSGDPYILTVGRFKRISSFLIKNL